MSKALEEVYEQAMQLPEDEQLELAERLYGPSDDDDLNEQWATEIERRIKAVDSGDEQTIPWEQVRSELWAVVGGRKH